MDMSGSSLNPGPESDLMEVDSQYGGPGQARTVIYSSKRPRISNTSTGQYLPKATIVDLPPEIFTEVCKYLRPEGLLSLARSCKSLREYLMKKAHQSIWLAAMTNVKNLPPCPPGFSEPQYLTVLFCNFCTACGNTRKKNTMDVTLLVRLCGSCERECLVQLVNISQVPVEIREFVHKSNVFGKGKGDQLPWARVLKSNVQDVIKVLGEAQESGDHHVLAEIKEQMRGAILERKAQSHKIICALELHENLVACERRDIRSQRYREIERRCINDLGMQPADLQFSWDSPERKKYYKLLKRPEQLHDREWGEIYPKIERLAHANRMARLAKEQKDQRQSQSVCQKKLGQLKEPLYLEIDPSTSCLCRLEGVGVLI